MVLYLDVLEAVARANLCVSPCLAIGLEHVVEVVQ